MAAIQRCAQSTLNWDHFETEGLLLLQMHPAILPQVTIVGLAIILAWYFDTFDFGFFKFTSKEKGDPVDELLKKKHQVVGKECIPGKDTCFLIVDSYFLENGRLTTKRDLLLEENTEYSLTGVEVESVKPVSWNNLDSRNWPVNKLVINSRYARLLVASGFIMNSLNFDESDHQDVLIAGLGGGVMSNFFSQISYLNIDTTVVEKEEFIINIAENYFDHFETDEMRIINTDFVDYLRKYDKKYDVIIVDACENKKTNVMCPVSETLKIKTVQLLKKRLTLNGILAVNVFVTQDNIKSEKEIFELFSNEFNSCFYLEYFKNKNVLLCSKRDNWTWKKQKTEFSKNVEIVDDMFEFKLSRFLH
ncbi:Methyltransferase-like protein 13 [Caenorhabditis elegans]|uniref:Methyltransferase-like protein 13 n=1 Tax=Caenorhabditis elegans TaxID=6239 RepID=Q22944_CAEEL|nr:Methyltransferase-like protein 13 [Caenorhabditis elegans]CCD65417.2 Methyltransferase-like protein 13 [Caenorhabditis elegans]|eukprot:NP_001342016.1 Uncharacterized protein CELE_C52B9.8 [Caenorhabditis elegans]